MNRNEFMAELTAKLSGLPTEERQAAIRFYEEYFEEAGPGREQEILTELGAPATVAESILKDYSSVPVVTDRVSYNRQSGEGATTTTAQSGTATDGATKTQGSWRDWAEAKMPIWAWAILLVFAIPMIGAVISAAMGLVGGLLGVVLAVIGVAFSVAAVGFVACAAIWLVGVAMVLAGLAGVVAGIVGFVANPAAGMLTIGISALIMSLGLLIVLLGACSVKLLPPVINSIVNVVRGLAVQVRSWIRKVGKKA